MFDPLQIPLAGVHSISASAGTGKTWTITTLYLRYILEAGVSADQILVTTFTEAATAELRDRLRARLVVARELLEGIENESAARRLIDEQHRESQLLTLLLSVGAWELNTHSRLCERLEDAILSFDQAPVFTIHGFCNRVLSELVFETGSRFDVEMVATIDDLLDEGLADFVSNWWTTSPTPLPRWQPLTESRYEQLREIVRHAANEPAFAIVPDHRELESLLQTPELSRFDELLLELSRVWQAERDSLRQWLVSAMESKKLNGNSFRLVWLNGSFKLLDQLVLERQPRLIEDSKDGDSVVKAFERLSADFLRDAIKAGQSVSLPALRSPRLIADLVKLAPSVFQLLDRQWQLLAARAAEAVREHVRQRKQALGQMSFGDLLHSVDQALGGSQQESLLASLRERYRVVMVDEFQDTDPIQFRIFRRAFLAAAGGGDSSHPPDANAGAGCGAFVMIGDPKQSIYRFRGADLQSYLAAIAETPTKNQHAMDTNWRSDESLVRAVQAIFQRTNDPFLNDRIRMTDVRSHYPDRIRDEAALRLTFVPRLDPSRTPTVDESLQVVMERVADDIVRQLNDTRETLLKDCQWRRVEPSDIAVLCRSSWHLRLAQESLLRRGVPSVLLTDESVFHSEEARALSTLLQALLAPGNLPLMMAALQTCLLGHNAESILALQDDSMRLAEIADRFHRWQEQWRRDGFIVMWRQLLEDEDTLKRLAGQLRGARRMTNLLHLGELLHRAATESHLGMDELLRWLERQRLEPQNGNDEALLRLESDADAVQLRTIHSSKGLEYPIVYCPTLWWVRSEHSEPQVLLSRLSSDANGWLELPELDVGSDLRDRRLAHDADENRAEERRLLYVALTRARHQCCLYWTAFRDAGRSALGALADDASAMGADADDATIERALAQWMMQLNVAGIEFTGPKDAETLADLGRYQPIETAALKLACRPVTRDTIPACVQTSFSSLAHSRIEQPLIEIADRDQVAAVSSDLMDADGRMPGSPKTDDRLVPLAELRGGARLGNVVHEVLEVMLDSGRHQGADFSNVLPVVRERLEKKLLRAQLETRWLDPLAEAATRCLTSTFAGGAFDGRLLDMSCDSIACELPFSMRLGSKMRGFHLDALAEAMERDPQPLMRQAGARVRAMSMSGLRGILSGFIDVLFEAEGRWYILDYKTNQLGPNLSNYESPSLAQAMLTHDYVLQYSLYCAAAKHFLADRVPGFDFERDFGGVFYFFLRGFCENDRLTHGVFFDQPTSATIEAIAAVVSGSVQSVTDH